jgi:ribosomal protein S18 acetylase RimI-like enzyme
MTERPSIRFATIEDIDRLMELWEESVREIRDVDGVAAQVDLEKTEERRQFFQWLIEAPDSGVTVAEAEGSGLVGMLTFQEFTNPDFFTVTRLALISSVHVRPAHRRRGLTQRMTEATLEWLTSRGVQEVQLANSPSNVAADRTWEKLGFEVVTVTRRRLLGPNLRGP